MFHWISNLCTCKACRIQVVLHRSHSICQLPLSFVLVCMSTTCLPDQIRMIGTFAMPVMRLTVAIMPFFPCRDSTAKLSSDFPGITQEFEDKWPAIVSFLMRALSVIELLFIVISGRPGLCNAIFIMWLGSDTNTLVFVIPHGKSLAHTIFHVDQAPVGPRVPVTSWKPREGGGEKKE